MLFYKPRYQNLIVEAIIDTPSCQFKYIIIMAIFHSYDHVNYNDIKYHIFNAGFYYYPLSPSPEICYMYCSIFQSK